MQRRALLLLGLGSLFCAGLNLPSFQPPQYPATTLENDGTSNGRYDVRKTVAWVDSSEQRVNCLDNLDTNTTIGATTWEPGTASNAAVDIQSPAGSLTSPEGGDNFTTLHLTTALGGVVSNLTLHPTGKNLYVGGSGGFTLPGSGDDYRVVPPGYSWYWGNPTLRVQGEILVNNDMVEIDTTQSFAYYERQWGDFNLSKGYFAFWAYLPKGELFHIWLLSPTIDGKVASGISTLWHPNGAHEVVPIDFNSTYAWNAWISSASNKTYFTDFQIDMPTSNTRLHFQQYAPNTEVRPAPTGRGQGGSISEAYAEGRGLFHGEAVDFFGHVEQLSFVHAVTPALQAPF